MAVISNGTTLIDAGAIDSGIATGSMTLINTLTASGSADLTFSSGITSTYKEYLFTFNNIHPADNSVQFLVNFRDGSTAYDATKTTSFFTADHSEAGSTDGLVYVAGQDLAQSTAFQPLTVDTGNRSDESCCGHLRLFDPASTTYVKNFFARMNNYVSNNYSEDSYTAGYCNVTAAIDGVQFKFASGNIDSGTIKLYGIK
jgi:hypothetical protein